ncbi:hypothetical protein [Caballeronia sp. LZ001]|uniref:hypothetical protein n=1 Tax=Caballeronia sp. LZ001 TaxID=3038553 RepID=UPI00286349CD|nr:hypothetical protein [Caballeronia sp. LZ001]MDR5804758.1 hypothetical protein [Caballeronia sp. LZ001]
MSHGDVVEDVVCQTVAGICPRRDKVATTRGLYAVITARLDEQADLWYLEARSASEQGDAITRTEALYVTKEKALSCAIRLTERLKPLRVLLDT